VQYVSIPNRKTRSEERRRWEKQRWFKKGQKWRTGCEGRISVIKRRHGLARCRYQGLPGMRRWVGLGVIADNLINLGTLSGTAARVRNSGARFRPRWAGGNSPHQSRRIPSST
jgi:IS5 family transposase